MIFIEDFDALKKDILSSKKNHFYRLIDQADSYHNFKLSDTPPLESTTYFCQAILNLSLAYKLTSDQRYLDDAIRFIDTVCNYPYWGNAHLVNVDLSASWILFGLSLAYDWLSDILNPTFKKKILDKLVLQSSIMYDYKKANEGKGWATNYFQNHNWINMTGLAACGYAIKREYPDAAKYIQEAKNNFKLVFEYLPDDGSDYEGVAYWRYGVYWLLVYAELLKNQEGYNYFEKSNFLKNTFYYRFYQSASELKKQLNFGDCHDRYSGHSAAMYYKFASEYNDIYAQTYGNMVSNELRFEEQYQSKIKPGILPEAWLELLWYNPNIKCGSFDDLPLVRKLDDLGLITIRDGFGPDSTVLSAKCGYPGGKKQWHIGTEYIQKDNKWIMALSHNHSDNLSFILTKGHSYLVIDEGYNRNIMPNHHNVLLVDGLYADSLNCNDVYMSSIKKRLEEYPDYNMDNYYGEIKTFNSNNGVTYFEMENTNIYPLNLKMKKVSRFILTNNLKYIVLIDTFISDNNHLYQSVFNTDTQLQQLSENRFYQKNGIEEMYLTTYCESELSVRYEKNIIKSVMTTQEPDKYMLQDLNCLMLGNVKPNKKHIQISVITFNKNQYVEITNEYIIYKY